MLSKLAYPWQSPYICSVIFFIVLDLRLTRLGESVLPFYYFYVNSSNKKRKNRKFRASRTCDFRVVYPFPYWREKRFP